MSHDQVALRAGSRVAGAQVGYAELALGRGLGLVLVILVRAVRGPVARERSRGSCAFAVRAQAGSYRSPGALALSARNGGDQEPMSLTAAKLPDGHSGPAFVVWPG